MARDSGILRITPPPMKPTPVMTPCITRPSASLSGSPGEVITSDATMAAMHEPMATSAWVRTPAGLPRSSRLMPSTIPPAMAAARRSTPSPQLEMTWMFSIMLPPHSVAEPGDVGDVVPAVPGIIGKHLAQRQVTAWLVRVPVCAGEVFIRHGPEQSDPSGVQRLQQRQRICHRTGARVRQLRPVGFVVRADDGIGLGERQAKAHIRVHVTVGHVMYHLPHRPA